MKSYREGEPIGSQGLILVKELDPIIKPTYKERRVRCICPICNKPFDTDLRRVVRNETSYRKPISKCPNCSKKENNQRIALCGKNSIIDITNRKFGKLTPIYDTGARQNRSVIWHCKCDCGNEIDVSQVDLQRGHTKSCGCMKSCGEQKIQEILYSLDITYEKEKVFQNCINPKTNCLLRFDFYLPDYNCCIEYDGVQHFKYSNSGWNNKKHFEKVQYRDNIKNQYCENNNIKLIRIPYFDFKKIDKNYILDKINSYDNNAHVSH